MKQITTIGLDLAKHVFQIHGADAEGSAVVNRKLRRAEVLRFFEKQPACLVGLEACSSSHFVIGRRPGRQAKFVRFALKEAAFPSVRREAQRRGGCRRAGVQRPTCPWSLELPL